MLELKGLLEKKEGEIFGIASTQSPDRDGEIIKASGWDLKNFKNNPVIMSNHKWHEFPIGKATGIAIEKGKLVFKMVLSEATNEAREAAQLVKEGILNSFSVGFIPKTRSEKDRNIIEESELLEISLVSIPANPQAIVTAKGMKDNAMAQSLTNDCEVYFKLASEVEQSTKKTEKKAKVESIELKLVQNLTGQLQNLCKELKQKAGEKK